MMNPKQKAKVIAAKPRVAKVAKVVTMPKKKRKLVVKKKAEPTPYSLDDAKIIESFMDEVVGMNGFRQDIYGWSYYEGGNFTQTANNFFEKQAERLDKYEMGEEFNEIVNERKIKETGKVHDISMLKHVEESSHGERWFDNNDYQEYNPEAAYGLINKDGEYYSSNRMRSTTKKYVTDVINSDGKKLLKLWTQVKKIIKKNK